MDQDIIITIDLSFIDNKTTVTNKLDNKNKEYLIRMGMVREDDDYLETEDDEVIL